MTSAPKGPRGGDSGNSDNITDELRDRGGGENQKICGRH